MSNLPILLLLIGGSILTIGDIIMKQWIETNNIKSFILGFLSYMIGMIFLAFSFKYKNIAIASMMFVIFNIITLALVSYFIFHEKLSYQQLFGISIGLLSVIILENS